VINVVVFGTGSFAQLVDLSLRRDSDYNVIAFTTTGSRIGDSFSGRPVVPFESLKDTFPADRNKMFIAIGYSKMNHVRSHFYAEAKSRGYELITFIGSKVLRLDSDEVGENCCIFDGTTLEPFSTVGDNVIVWGGSHLGHHSSIGAHSFLAPQVAIAGHTTVGSHCFLGINSTVGDHVNIADHSLIGAGVTILRDTSQRDVYVGRKASPYAGDISRFFGD
jgi:sugar O-acyltransferase (sialic acid O-acetyltransferase NeuD family)